MMNLDLQFSSRSNLYFTGFRARFRARGGRTLTRSRKGIYFVRMKSGVLDSLESLVEPGGAAVARYGMRNVCPVGDVEGGEGVASS